MWDFSQLTKMNVKPDNGQELLAFPEKNLSRNTLLSIIKSLTSDLAEAKQEICELRKSKCSSCAENNDLLLPRSNSCPEISVKQNKPASSVVGNAVRNCSNSAKQSKVNPSKRKTDSADPAKTDEVANVKTLIFCRFCATRHERGKLFCPARDKICEKCNLKNHFASCCQTSPKRIRMTALGDKATGKVNFGKSQSEQSHFESVDSRMEPQEKVNKKVMRNVT